jgi:primase-polymerase (primpol)-like protein
MMAETTGAITLIPGNIPDELTERPQWVCWCYEERDGKLTKVLYTPGSLRRASSTDLMAWDTFEGALAAYTAAEPPYDGIGFVFSSADPFVGIDLDDCRNPQTGEIAPWAQKIIDRVHSGYIEVSPSSTGIHVIIEGKMRGEKTQRKVPGEAGGKIEMYCQSRFFTVTGVLL